MTTLRLITDIDHKRSVLLASLNDRLWFKWDQEIARVGWIRSGWALARVAAICHEWLDRELKLIEEELTR